MKKLELKKLLISIGLLLTFILWTVAICNIDLKQIGPQESVVGFATINGKFHNFTGTTMLLYTITDWLGFVPIIVCLIFAFLGLVQAIKRKSILKVDADILVLGLFYIIVIACYFLFEMVAINYRPVLIDGYLEASYPSSTTLLVLNVMPTAFYQIRKRMKESLYRKILSIVIWVFTICMVIGRLISGVHWLTDIVGSIILCGGLVMLYIAICDLVITKPNKL